MQSVHEVLSWLVHNPVALALVKIGVVLGAVLGVVPFIILWERKLIAWIQCRPGPNRVGPWGILQGIVDGVKLFLKEDYIPPFSEKFLFYLAPILVVAAAFLNLSIIPFGPSFEAYGQTVYMTITDLDLGVLFIFAVGGLGVYGITIAGYASNNKYSLLGGLRAAAQLISYELTLGLGIIGVLMIVGTLNLREISDMQGAGIFGWYVWQQPVGFLMFFIAMFAETNRLPFDLPEGESELTGGYHTEYSSMKFALFFMGEYVNMIVMACLISVLFLGGYHSPFGTKIAGIDLWGVATVIAAIASYVVAARLRGSFGYIGVFVLPALLLGSFAIDFLPPWLAGPAWVFVKMIVFMTIFIWARAALPRFRFDQLMDFGWKILLPIGLVNLFGTAVIIAVVGPDAASWVKPAALAVFGFALLAVIETGSTNWRRKSMRAKYSRGVKLQPFTNKPV